MNAGLGMHDIPVVILRKDITHIVGGEKFYFPCGTALYSRKADLKDFTDDELMSEIKSRGFSVRYGINIHDA